MTNHVQRTHAAGALAGAAVAVWDKNPGHTGILFEHSDGSMMLLHLASHQTLRMNQPTRKNGWVRARIPKERLEQVAALCERIWHKHGTNIPYGFRYVATRFSRAGEFKKGLGTGETGLTCATFVLAVFASVGLDLLRLEEWEKRPEDGARFEEILNTFKEGGVPAPALAIMKQQIDAVRYRPLEVAGGSMFTPPASFQDASGRATEIEQELRGE
ncbi:MAG: hypothetical protein MUF64_05485 [Polyangiaceae bacterium]|jgi:hypothetical protein|nr:hypothetical protein [Polyangiaceae bacterium]